MNLTEFLEDDDFDAVWLAVITQSDHPEGSRNGTMSRLADGIKNYGDSAEAYQCLLNEPKNARPTFGGLRAFDIGTAPRV
jgi:hypothetical protein